MSRTLNFADSLLAKARKFHEAGLDAQAERLLLRLSRLQEMAPPVAEEIHARLGQIRLDQEDYRRARRHFAAATALAAGTARYHCLLALAQQDGRPNSSQRAAACYRRALKLEPKNPRYLADYGLLMLDVDNRDEALARCRQALECAPNDADLLDRILDGLLAHNEVDAARELARLALFRNGRDRRFRTSWHRLQFHVLAAAQEIDDSVETHAEIEPAILPFLRPCFPQPKAQPDAAILRHDSTDAGKTPHLVKPLRTADKRHA